MTPYSATPARQPELKIEYEPLAPDLYEVRLTGELGMGSVGSLDRVFKSIFDMDVYKIAVNMEALQYIASSGIGIITASAKTAKENDGELVLAAVQPRVRQVFDLVGLHRIIRFSDTLKDAVKLLKKV
jgi:anti-anti-sigma factor